MRKLVAVVPGVVALLLAAAPARAGYTPDPPPPITIEPHVIHWGMSAANFRANFPEAGGGAPMPAEIEVAGLPLYGVDFDSFTATFDVYAQFRFRNGARTDGGLVFVVGHWSGDLASLKAAMAARFGKARKVGSETDSYGKVFKVTDYVDRARNVMGVIRDGGAPPYEVVFGPAA